MNLNRMWINQPSTLQPLHHLHGTNVLALADTAETVRVWFLSGAVISQQVSALALSRGWRETTTAEARYWLTKRVDEQPARGGQ